MSHFDFDEFQRDIEAAEKYLKETTARKNAAALQNESMTEESVQGFGDTLFFASDLEGSANFLKPMDESTLSDNTAMEARAGTKDLEFAKTIRKFDYGTSNSSNASATIPPAMSKPRGRSKSPINPTASKERSSFSRSQSKSNSRSRSRSNDTRLNKSTTGSTSNSQGNKLPNTTAIDRIIELEHQAAAESTNAFKYLKTKEDLKKEADEAFHQVCQFKPQYYTRKPSDIQNVSMDYDDSVLNAPSRGGYPSKTNTSNQSQVKKSVDMTRINQIQLEYKKNLQQREKLKDVSLNMDIAMNCSFAPKLCDGSERIMKRRQAQHRAQLSADDSQLPVPTRGRSVSPKGHPTAPVRRASSVNTRDASNISSRNNLTVSLDVSDRLYEDAAQRYEHLQWLRDHKLETEKQDTHQPFIHPSTNQLLFKRNHYEYRPIQERLGELHRIKQNKLNEIRQSVEDEHKNICTFAPVISSHSERIISNKIHQSLDRQDSNVASSSSDKTSTIIKITGYSRYESAATMDDSVNYDDDIKQHKENMNNNSNGHTNIHTNKSPSPLHTRNTADRLISYGSEYLKHKHQLAIRQEVEDAISFNQFKPRLCKGTATIINKNDVLSRTSFSERQQDDLQKRKQHQQELSTYYHNIEYNQPTRGLPNYMTPGFSFAAPTPTATTTGNTNRQSSPTVSRNNVSTAGIADATISPIQPATNVPTNANQATTTANTTNEWFKPNLKATAKATNKLLQANDNYKHNQSVDDFVYRMSTQQAAAYETHRRELEYKIYRDPAVYTYKPTVDPISQQLGRKASIKELMENRKGKQIREENIRAINEKISSECPFKPRINHYKGDAHLHTSPLIDSVNTSSNGTPNSIDGCILDSMLHRKVYNISPTVARINMKEPEQMARDIRLHVREKEEKRRQQLAVKEIEELTHCTFQPDTSSTSKSYYKYSHAPQPMSTMRPSVPIVGYNEQIHGSPTSYIALQQQQQFNTSIGYDPTLSQPPMIVVKGLNRHLELKRLADHLKQMKLDREKEVFTVKKVNQYRRPEDSSTIIEPFHIHEAKRGPSKVVLDLQQDYENELTFSPVTNDSIQRGIIRNVLHVQ